MKSRFGLFLIIIGLILLVVYFFSDPSMEPKPGLFFSGLGAVCLGTIIAWRFRPAPKPSERFRTVRKVFNDRQNPKK